MVRESSTTSLTDQSRADVTWVSVEEFQPNVYNPNRQSETEFELLCRSMSEDGFTTPILVQQDTNVIIDGEHRWRAARAIGLEQIPVVYAAMDDVEMRIATLRHNRARGTEDLTLTAQVVKQLEELDGMEWAQDSLMMDDVEASILLMEGFSAPPIAPQPRAFSDVQARRVQDGKDECAVKLAADGGSWDYLYNLNLVYTQAESECLRAVLGENHATRILELCTARWTDESD